MNLENTKQNFFRLDEPLSDSQKSFLRSALERSGLFETFSLTGDGLGFELKPSSRLQDAEETWNRLKLVARTHKVDEIFARRYATYQERDVMAKLLELGDVRAMGEGCFVYQGMFLKLLRALDQLVVGFATDLGGIEQEYPVRWPVTLFKQINYFRDFPQNILLISGVKKDHSSLQKVAETYDIAKPFASVQVDESFAPATHALGTSTCDPCYYVFRDSDKVRDGVYFAKSKCFRNETSARNELDRLTEFSMREVIVIGSRDFVLATRERYLQFVFSLVEFLELSARVESASDPFFTNDAALKKLYQSHIESKYEILADLGAHRPELAVGSINWHGDHFGKAFSAKTADGQAHYSSCLAFGLERMAFAFLTQYTVDPRLWPEQVRSLLAAGSNAAVGRVPLKVNGRVLESAQVSSAVVGASVLVKDHSADHILATVKSCLVQTFGDGATRGPLHKDRIPAWDSIGHVSLVMALEAAFGIQVPPADYGHLHVDADTIVRYLLGAGEGGR